MPSPNPPNLTHHRLNRFGLEEVPVGLVAAHNAGYGRVIRGHEPDMMPVVGGAWSGYH